MTQNSIKTWKLLYHLNNKKAQTKEHFKITLSQISHSLIEIDKTRKRKSDAKVNRINEGEVENFENPVKMDRVLTYNVHCEDTGKKVATRNKILYKIKYHYRNKNIYYNLFFL